jgi:hypothetical protein
MCQTLYVSLFSAGFSKIKYCRYIYRTVCYPFVWIQVISQPNFKIINFNYVCKFLRSTIFTCNSMFRLHALQDYLKSCRYFRRQYFAWESVCVNCGYKFFFYPLSLSFLQFVFPLSLLSSCLVVRSSRYVLLILILLSLQSVVNLGLFQNCPPLLSVLILTSPFPHAHLL